MCQEQKNSSERERCRKGKNPEFLFLGMTWIAAWLSSQDGELSELYIMYIWGRRILPFLLCLFTVYAFLHRCILNSYCSWLFIIIVHKELMSNNRYCSHDVRPATHLAILNRLWRWGEMHSSQNTHPPCQSAEWLTREWTVTNNLLWPVTLCFTMLKEDKKNGNF